MKHYILYPCLILLLACQNNPKEQTTVMVDTTNVLIDSVVVDTIATQEIEPVVELKELDKDSKTIWIDRVNHFRNTNEIYVSLSYLPQYNWKASDSIRNKTDSVIFADDETSRRRLPLEIAREYFDLSFLDSLNVFNYNHELLGQARIKRVEYYDAMIVSQYIAVLTQPFDLKGDRFYGVGGVSDFNKSLVSSELEDEELEKSIRQHVANEPRYDWGIESQLIQPYNLIYSAYSFLNQQQEEKSYLLEIDNSTKAITTMAEITNDFNIQELSPVSVQINEKPVLLLWVGVPDTDMLWFTPAVFDGQQYVITNNRKISLTEFDKMKPETAAKLDQLVGAYEYIYPHNTEDLIENHYLVLHVQGEALIGRYYGTSDDFDHAREGYLPGFFMSEISDVRIENDSLFYTVNVDRNSFYNQPIPLNIQQLEELDTTYSKWEIAEYWENKSRTYIAKITPDHLVFPNQFEDRIFNKIEVVEELILKEKSIGSVVLPFEKNEMLPELQKVFADYIVTKEVGQQDGPDFPLYSIESDGEGVVYIAMNWEDTLVVDRLFIRKPEIKDEYGLAVNDYFKDIKAIRGDDYKSFTDLHQHTYIYYDRSKIMYEISGNLYLPDTVDFTNLKLTEEHFGDWNIINVIWRPR